MTRSERHRLALAALLRFARSEPVIYDELADREELCDRMVRQVDEALSGVLAREMIG